MPALNLLFEQVIAGLYTFLWPMIRISALLLTAPVFSLEGLLQHLLHL